MGARRTIPLIVFISLATVTIGGQRRDLPPRDAFLTDAREALARSQGLWYRYSYKERRTDLHMNPFGRMGTGGTRVFEVTPSTNPKLVYRREIERNGVAVTPEELARQDAEYRERTQRYEQELDRNPDRQRNEDLLAKRRAQMMIDDVVNTLQFELVRREFRGGTPVIVVSFAAKRDARPVTKEGRIAKAFRGELWIEEASRELINLKAVAVDDVSFGGFIAKIYEGTEAMIERREIDRGVWMPTRLSLSGDVRALFRTAHIDHVVEWFDYEAISNQ